jgi:hypothetical protein
MRTNFLLLDRLLVATVQFPAVGFQLDDLRMYKRTMSRSGLTRWTR